MIEANQEGISRRDFEGGGGGRWSRVGNSNVLGTIDGSRVENLILREGA